MSANSTKDPPGMMPDPDSLALDHMSADEARTWVESIACADHPEDLSDERHLALIESALGISLACPAESVATYDETLAPASEDELREAELLSLALDGKGSHPLAALACAIGSAANPKELSPFGQKRAERAFSHAGTSSHPKLLDRVARPTAYAATLLAVAAAFALFLLPAEPRETSNFEGQALVASRSLSPLFTPQSFSGTTTDRMDRIVMVRSRELRHNRYLAWRVR